MSLCRDAVFSRDTLYVDTYERQIVLTGNIDDNGGGVLVYGSLQGVFWSLDAEFVEAMVCRFPECCAKH